MNPYERFVHQIGLAVRQAGEHPPGGMPVPAMRAAMPGARRALIFSPHPDDEVIIGGMALRLQRELGWEVVNVAVTQGSNPERRQGRWEELKSCCMRIGFGLLATAPGGLEGISLATRSAQPALWDRSVERIAAVLREQAPHLIFFPHDDDWNSTHIGTHHLIVDALRRCGPAFGCITLETEFWGAMKQPNLLVESSEKDVADLITALSFHVGEVKRNPYHLLLPAWMMDNVRRGGELVGGQGGAAPDFLFGTLYLARRWRDGAFAPLWQGGRFVAGPEDLQSLCALF